MPSARALFKLAPVVVLLLTARVHAQSDSTSSSDSIFAAFEGVVGGIILLALTIKLVIETVKHFRLAQSEASPVAPQPLNVVVVVVPRSGRRGFALAEARATKGEWCHRSCIVSWCCHCLPWSVSCRRLLVNAHSRRGSWVSNLKLRVHVFNSSWCRGGVRVAPVSSVVVHQCRSYRHGRR